MKRAQRNFCRAFAAAALGLAAGAAHGAGWAQYRGSDHDGVAAGRLLAAWSGPVTNPVWQVPLPCGISSFVVGDGRAFTLVKRTVAGAPREVCVALSAATGAEAWATAIDSASYPDGGVGEDDGPRPTPAVCGEGVYTLSSWLKLARLKASDGSVQWQKDLPAEYGASVIGWQNAASPVVENGLVFVNANAGSQRLMAFRIADGSLAWRSQNEAMTHSTPVTATIHGVRQLVFATQSGLVSVDPASGTRLWKQAWPFSYNTSLAASPVVWENVVFASASYGMGSVAVQASLTNGVWTPRQLWASGSLQAYWTTPVCSQGYLYGPFGLDANAPLKCLDIRTGAVKWSVSGFGRGGIVLAGSRLLSLTEKGQLVLAKATPLAYTEMARCTAVRGYNGDTNKCWNTPAAAGSRVFVHSTALGAAFDLLLPELLLDPPQPAPGQGWRLTARAADGSALTAARAASLEVRASTNLAASAAQWTLLTNRAVLLNGAARLERLPAEGAPRQFFRVSEPE